MIQNKKAVSVMVGYVLLIAFGIGMGVVVYGYLKTYVPTESLTCPDGVSIFLKSASCNASAGELNISLKNTGKFNLAGYFIKATNSSDQEIATFDLSQFFLQGGIVHGNAILVETSNQNKFKIKEEMGSRFSGIAINITKIEIIPVRWQTDEDQTRIVTCGSARIREELTC
jgi:hypothetical protein